MADLTFNIRNSYLWDASVAMWARYRREMEDRSMIPPPPTDPPAYDLSLIALPTLEPMEKPRNERSTRRLGLPERMASLWCRANGDDHSKRVRRGLDNIIARIRGGKHE